MRVRGALLLVQVDKGVLLWGLAGHCMSSGQLQPGGWQCCWHLNLGLLQHWHCDPWGLQCQGWQRGGQCLTGHALVWGSHSRGPADVVEQVEGQYDLGDPCALFQGHGLAAHRARAPAGSR